MNHKYIIKRGAPAPVMRVILMNGGFLSLPVLIRRTSEHNTSESTSTAGRRTMPRLVNLSKC